MKCHRLEKDWQPPSFTKRSILIILKTKEKRIDDWWHNYVMKTTWSEWHNQSTNFITMFGKTETLGNKSLYMCCNAKDIKECIEKNSSLPDYPPQERWGEWVLGICQSRLRTHGTCSHTPNPWLPNIDSSYPYSSPQVPLPCAVTPQTVLEAPLSPHALWALRMRAAPASC